MARAPGLPGYAVPAVHPQRGVGAPALRRAGPGHPGVPHRGGSDGRLGLRGPAQLVEDDGIDPALAPPLLEVLATHPAVEVAGEVAAPVAGAARRSWSSPARGPSSGSRSSSGVLPK